MYTSNTFRAAFLSHTPVSLHTYAFTVVLFQKSFLLHGEQWR